MRKYVKNAFNNDLIFEDKHPWVMFLWQKAMLKITINRHLYLEDMIHIHNGMLFGHKKDKKCHLQDMDATRDSHISEVKSERERQILYHLYVKSKIWHKCTCLQNRNKLTDIENRFAVAKGEWGSYGMDRSLGLVDANYYMHLLEWISNEALLYSTGSHIQSNLLGYNMIEYSMSKKMCVCVYYIYILCIYML